MEFGLSGAFADTLESVSTWISHGLAIFSWIANGEMPLYLNPHPHVNTILTSFGRSSMPDAKTQARDQLKF
jgi:hypothetical protein